MSNSEKQLNIVGIGGLPRSGKDELARVLIKTGFYGVSLGDIVRNVSRTRHADKPDPISVNNMTETSNFLRQTQGPDFALKQALELYREAEKDNSYKGLLVWSVRAPVEVDYVLANHGHMVWLETSDPIRHHRAMNDLREAETKISLKEFLEQEAKQWVPQADLPPEIQMNVAYVKEHATDILVNESDDLDEFHKKAIELISNL